MRVLNHTETLVAICLATKKWGMYLAFDWVDDFQEVIKAAPLLDGNHQAIFDGSAIVLFDTQAECEDAFVTIVGDDGPTKKNQYAGPAKVYALTCSPDGECQNENT